MAIVSGAAVTDSSNGFRLEYELVQSPSTVTKATAEVTHTLRLYVGTKGPISDSNNSQTVTGDFSASGSVSISTSSTSPWSTANRRLIRTISRTVTLSYEDPVKSSFTASLSGIEAVSGTASVSGSITAPKRPVMEPDAPTGVMVSRVSDTQHTVNWSRTNPGAVSKPYQKVYVERWDSVSSAYKLVATLGNVSSWSDATTVANRAYRYRVRAWNSTGYSSYAYSAYITTKPAAVTGLAAAKSSGNVVLTWKNNAGSVGTKIKVLHATNGMWDASPLITLTGQPTTWTHPAPNPAVTHTYRLVTVADAYSPTLESAQSTSSNIIQLLTPPLAPSNLSPSSSAIDASEDNVFSWRHNTVDGTEEKKFELEHRLAGGTWVSTGAVTSAESKWVLPAGTYSNSESVEWRVKTWGDHADGSEFSALAVVSTSARPTVVLDLAPGGVVDHPRTGVSWSYFDEETTPQAQWQATLYAADGVSILESPSGAGGATSASFSYFLQDGGSYRRAVKVRDGAGLWSEEVYEDFTVSYALPVVPVVDAQFIPETGSVVVSITNTVPESGEVETTANELWYAIDDGDWVKLADAIPPNGSFTDYVPHLTGANHYKVVALSDLPSAVEAPPVQVIADDLDGWIYFNAGPAFATICRARKNADVSITSGRQRSRKKFNGRSLPVNFDGGQVSRKGSVSVRIAPNFDGSAGSSAAEFTAMANAKGIGCYRDPTGERLFVSFDQVSIRKTGVVQELSWGFEEVQSDR